jgi:hypothetical protein
VTVVGLLHPGEMGAAVAGASDVILSICPPHAYLSGDEAGTVAALYTGSPLATRIVANASAVKMAYAAWSKGTTALLLAIRDVAAANGVEDEWRLAAPELAASVPRAEAARANKGWRWIGEMEEIADTFAAAGRPDGFHRAAAEVYRT